MNDFAVELRQVTKIFDSHTAHELGECQAAVQTVDLQIRAGEFFTLLGPSGCGKTTTLRMIAGFETPTRGEVYILGQPMSKVPPYRRPVNTVFQNYALFPHLTVAQNVAFGLEVQGVPRAERDRRVREALELVRLPELGQRRPARLSGGQQQRVALARALVNHPSVLLLDEPLGALDLKLRKEMQLELKHLQMRVGITFIYVTHDQEEALTMSDRIAVMSQGAVLQVDEPVALYENPATRFVADFIGETNFLAGQVTAAVNGHVSVRIGAEEVLAKRGRDGLQTGQAVTLTVRPEKLALNHPGAGSGSSALTGAVGDVVYIGTDTRYVVNLPTGENVVARIQNMAGRGLGEFRVGEPVQVSWDWQDARALVE